MKRAALASFLVSIVMATASGAPMAGAGETTMTQSTENIVVAQSQAGFQRWRDGFRRKALNAGIRGRVFDTAFQNVGVNARVVELDGKQSEFTKTIWDYLDSAVSDKRVSNGRGKARDLSRVLGNIERSYGVDWRVVMAIWGVETNFGGFMGGINVIEALATLAYDGRRRAWAERELINALKIIQNGDIAPSAMEGSWAGAMGHTQFMPSSYLAYAQDFTGNGKRDIWASDPTDGLASAANYLRRHGWTKGQPWGVEVQLPGNFDFGSANIKPRRPISYWNAKGVRGIDGKPVPNYGNAGLWIPAGASGPKFVVFKNFSVIKRYNNANSYALAVGHLGDRIAGAGDFRAAWPRGDRALRRSEARALQTKLTQRGFSTQGADGIIGPNTIAAIRAFQRANGMVPDGYASLELLKRLN